MERTKIISAIDTVDDIQLLHSRSEQIAMVLGNKYFNEEPMDSTGKMLFGNRYKEMNSLLDVIIQSNMELQKLINKLHTILDECADTEK